MGRRLSLIQWTDSSAAKGMAQRLGVGKVKHLQVKYLWLQALLDNEKAKMNKIDGTKNTGDLMTKYLEPGVMQKHMLKMGLEKRAGRHPLAPEVEVDTEVLRTAGQLLAAVMRRP
jgi:hypothetical protein